MLNRRRFTAASVTALLAGMSFRHQAAAAGGAKSFEIAKSAEEWKKILTPQQYYVLRDHGTERPFSHAYDKLYDPGVYNCAGCDLPLYASQTKFNSGTGWPSFWKEIEGNVGTSVDKSLWMERTEVHCRRCGGHLGHVFEDGPKPTGLRHCINGVSLKFVPGPKTAS